MATSIDLPPLYDGLVKRDATMSDIWTGWLSQFVDTLIQYLSQFGVFIPQLSTDERDAIQSLMDGQMIYNTTLHKFQGVENGVWKTFTTT